MPRTLWKLISVWCSLIVTCVDYTKCDKHSLSASSEVYIPEKTRAVEYCVIGNVQGNKFQICL